MTTLLQLIVEEFEMSPEAIFMIRFTKRLRCQFRQARYTANFKRCISYIKKMSHGATLDGKTTSKYPKSEVRKTYCKAQRLDVEDCKGVYKSMAKFNRDVVANNLKIHKTMCCVGGRVFFLCEEE